jgi:hypothetical protein
LIFLFLSDLSSRSILLSVRFCSSFPAPRLRFVFPISFHRCWDLLNFRCQVFFPLWLLFPAQSAFDLCPWFPPVRRDRRAGRSDHFTTQPSSALIFFGSGPSLLPAQLVRGGFAFSCCRPHFSGVNFLPAGLRLLWRHRIDLLSRFCPSQALVRFSARECQVLSQPISLPPTEFSALGPFLVAA